MKRLRINCLGLGTLTNKFTTFRHGLSNADCASKQVSLDVASYEVFLHLLVSIAQDECKPRQQVQHRQKRCVGTEGRH
jgi:hypothetical protein